MIQKATHQMAQFYGIPSRGSGALTDTHVSDIQAGAESTLALATTIMHGANFVLHACGILSSYLAMSYEKFLVDEEVCGMLRRMLRPLNVTDERIDFDTIKSVGIGGEYLTHPSTFEHCRTEFFLPDVMIRDDFETWQNGGKKRADERVMDIFNERIAQYKRPEIDSGIERDLSKFVAERKAAQT